MSVRRSEECRPTAGSPTPERSHTAKGSDVADGACSCGVTLDDRLGQAYNEEGFHYLLTIELKRSERSGRPFLLLLVDLREQPGGSARIDRAVAATLFSSLCRCLRETDFVGWYRVEYVVGAVLTECRAGARTQVSRLVRHRLTAALADLLSMDIARRLRVRVYQQPAPESVVSGRPTALGLS
jgi:hypothetical protein